MIVNLFDFSKTKKLIVKTSNFVCNIGIIWGGWLLSKHHHSAFMITEMYHFYDPFVPSIVAIFHTNKKITIVPILLFDMISILT